MEDKIQQQLIFEQKYQQLNSYQRQAVLDESRACLVNACVGSGKTTVLTAKVEYLMRVKGIPLEKMAVMTFTNRAADEILGRLGLMEERPKGFGTFHSVCMNLLKQELPVEELGYRKDFEILEPDQELELVLSLAKEHALTIKYKNRLKKRLEQERALFESGRTAKIKDDLFKVFPLLDARKKEENKMTFSDLIDHTLTLLKSHPVLFSWVLVDEIQDCNPKQAELLRAFCGKDTCFFGVGDPNQMIYSFRGSEETVYFKIKNQFAAKELSLPINYRSASTILAAANRFRQYGRNIEGEAQSETEKIPVCSYYDTFLEAEILGEKIRSRFSKGIPYTDMAILYRTQEQSIPLEKAFDRMGIPYKVSGKEEQTAKDEPEKEIQKTDPSNGKTKDAVHLMTAHASKGLEFSDVYIIGLNPGLFPIRTKRMEDQMEEQRLFFVAVTRARTHLELSYYTNPTRPDVFGEPCAFLKRIPEELLLWEKEKSQKEKSEHLQNLRKEVLIRMRSSETEGSEEEFSDPTVMPAPEVIKEQETVEEENNEAEKNTAVKYAIHPRYGKGVILSENDLSVEVEFEGYGTKSFLKMFGELTFES